MTLFRINENSVKLSCNLMEFGEGGASLQRWMKGGGEGWKFLTCRRKNTYRFQYRERSPIVFHLTVPLDM